MKIASKIHNRDKSPRRVHIHGKLYVFSPIEDKLGDTHYVAEVNHSDHAAVLLASEHFYELGKDQQKEPALARPAKGTESDPPPPPPTDEATTEEAKALLKGSVSGIATSVGKVSSIAVVRVALDLEREAGGRKNVISLLEATLQGAKAAGLTG